MPDNPKVPLAATRFVTHQETSAVTIPPDTLLKPGAVTVQGSTLTVKNAELASLIQAKLASATQLATNRAATDADVSVGVKVHF
jgi:hypothetical protein